MKITKKELKEIVLEVLNEEDLENTEDTSEETQEQDSDKLKLPASIGVHFKRLLKAMEDNSDSISDPRKRKKMLDLFVQYLDIDEFYSVSKIKNFVGSALEQ